MAHRAVIYIHTSSELQGEKSSPIEQEANCRRLAEEKGLTVVHVYRDVEKYRVGNKLVEPSGSRSVAQTGLDCWECSKTPPEMNSMSSSPGVKTGCIVVSAPC